MNTYYLNDGGSRWVFYSEGQRDPRHMRVQVIEADGTSRVRAVDYWESFGNFAAASFRIRGVRFSGLPEDTECSAEGLPVIRLVPEPFQAAA